MALLILALATLWTFAEVRHNGLCWDDKHNLVHNERYRGFGPEHLGWMFTTSFGGHYQPLSWLSLAADCRVWGGVSAVGFHTTNVAFHLATAIGFFFVTRRLLAAALPQLAANGLVFGALAASLLFAVHPLRVESVAWATERRDVLSGALLMLCILLYLRAVSGEGSTRRPIPFALSAVCCVLSLLSKASGVVLPVILILLDIYPLRRFSPAAQAAASVSKRRLLIEKLWFAVPAVVIAVAALLAQARAGALRSLADHSLALRVGQAFYGVAFYLVKTIWPAGLVPLYEQRPDAAGLDLPNVLATGLVITISVAVWMLRRRYIALLIAWAAYIVALSPVLGLAQSGPQVVADRYSYLACMPWALLAGAVAALLWNATPPQQPTRRIATASVLVLIVGALMVAARSQTRIWRDSYTLWSTVIDRAPQTPTAHANLAVALNERGEFSRARRHCLEALRLLPGNRTAHRTLGRAALELGDLDAAEKHCRIALQIASDVGKTDTGTMFNLAVALTKLGRLDEAEQVYRSLVAWEPENADWHYGLAGLIASRGRYAEARPILEEVVRLEPHRVEAYFRLGVIAVTLNDPATAIGVWRKGLEIDPDDVRIRAQLAWLLATCHVDSLRDGDLALQLVGQADYRADKKENLKASEAFAAALAETGDFTAATAVVEALLADPTLDLAAPVRARLRSQLERYQRLEPLRE